MQKIMWLIITILMCGIWSAYSQSSASPEAISGDGYSMRGTELIHITLKALGAEINEINRANGWNVLTRNEFADKQYKVPAVLALIHSEVSEALEAFRRGDRSNFEEEMADVLIRVLDCMSGLDVDIDKVVSAKLDKNRARAYRHGNKRI